jgi:hypothetical protein
MSFCDICGVKRGLARLVSLSTSFRICYREPYLGLGIPETLRKLMTAEMEPTRASVAFFKSYSVTFPRFREGRDDEEDGDCGRELAVLCDVRDWMEEEEFCIRGSSSSHTLLPMESHC